MKLMTLRLCYSRTPNLKLLLGFLFIFFFAFVSSYRLDGQVDRSEKAKQNLILTKLGENKGDPSTDQSGISRVPLTDDSEGRLGKISAQMLDPNERCAFVQVEAMLQEKFPARQTKDEFEKWMKVAKKELKTKGVRRAVVTIPVVVHVIEGGSTIITDAQVLSQIEVLNEDFRRMNDDASNTPQDFVGVASDVEINFCLATVDPDGDPTSGITRYDGGQSAYSVGEMELFVKPSTIWHPDFYFNIWCAPLPGGLLGYAQFPSNSTLEGFEDNEGPGYTDGIVVRDIAFGVGGTAVPGLDLGRTATHEAGHFFGLRHIGGDGPCEADDFCLDTPSQAGQNNNMVGDCEYDPNAPLGSSRNDCDDGPGDLPDQFMNYMDYSDDACMNLFTSDQKSRMDVVLEFSPRRGSLINSMVCQGVPPSYPYLPYENAPENDLCAGAIPIECGDEISGSTILASPREQPENCSPETEAPGVWYSIVSDGSPIQASLCSDGTDYDTKIGVYTGGCEGLVCLNGDDDGCGGLGVPSTVTVATVAGETYYIFVTGWNGSTGDFILSINCDVEPPPPSPDNDFCDGAVVVECGSVVDGKTVGAVMDLMGTCGTAIDAPGVWYNITGTGGFITASVCNLANYDTKINIIEAVDCDSDLFCVTGNDDGPGCIGFTSEASWLSEEGVNYYIYVNGFDGETGEFTLLITCNDIAENDQCEDAIALDCDSSVDGSTTFATDTNPPSEEDCSEDPFSDVQGPGVWYTLQGTGDSITLSTCNSADFDTKIDVYTGECGAFTCYAGNEDGDDCEGFTSELTIDTEEGVTYHVYISGYSFTFFGIDFVDQGDFTLNVECACVADAGECATVYNGYEPASCTDLTASLLYGVGPYEYAWSNGMSTETITVCPTVSTTYYVTITDAEGCSSEDSVYVDVIDVACGNNGNKVQICHKPGNKQKTLCIGADDIEDHLCHGDLLGACGTVVLCGEPYACPQDNSLLIQVSNRSGESEAWNISPNPATDAFRIQLEEYLGQSISIHIMDTAGKVVFSENTDDLADSSLEVRMDDAPKGMYYVRLKTESIVSTKKVLLIR